jgi:predicted transcriptional regulator
MYKVEYQKKPVTIRLHPQKIEALKRIAKEKKTTCTKILDEAFVLYLESESAQENK